MTQIAEQYGKVLYELKISQADVEAMWKAFEDVPVLMAVLDNPVLEKYKKHSIIEKVFPESLHNFLKMVSDHKRTSRIKEIREAWKTCVRQEEHILAATLYCVHDPNEEQREQMNKFVKNRFGAVGVELTVIHQPELIGGFVLCVGDREFDWSLQGRIRQLEQRLIRR